MPPVLGCFAPLEPASKIKNLTVTLFQAATIETPVASRVARRLPDNKLLPTFYLSRRRVHA
jgi:hypothetical protein